MISTAKAVFADISKLGKLGNEFSIAGGSVISFVPEVFERTWVTFLSQDVGVIFLLKSDEDIIGALGALKFPCPNSGEMIATELFWFVNSENRGKGLRLLKEFESWAAEHGIKKILIAHLTGIMPEKIKKIYTRMGYNEMETHYLKEVK